MWWVRTPEFFNGILWRHFHIVNQNLLWTSLQTFWFCVIITHIKRPWSGKKFLTNYGKAVNISFLRPTRWCFFSRSNEFGRGPYHPFINNQTKTLLMREKVALSFSKYLHLKVVKELEISYWKNLRPLKAWLSN